MKLKKILPSLVVVGLGISSSVNAETYPSLSAEQVKQFVDSISVVTGSEVNSDQYFQSNIHTYIDGRTKIHNALKNIYGEYAIPFNYPKGIPAELAQKNKLHTEASTRAYSYLYNNYWNGLSHSELSNVLKDSASINSCIAHLKRPTAWTGFGLTITQSRVGCTEAARKLHRTLR